MMDWVKVVTCEEMARIEKTGDKEAFMQRAGREIARVVINYIKEHKLTKKVTLLVGKGNNGGDAYSAGISLLNAGIDVQAVRLQESVSPLSKKFENVFKKKDGKFVQKMEGVILDGLFGTGFKGELDNEAAKIIRMANASGLPILAIDIPSGLNGTSGEVGDIAIEADETIVLGFPKIGFFLKQGWNHVGRLHVVDFGLSKASLLSAESVAYLPKKLRLPKILRNRHKYQAGYVIGFAGSKMMPGAAKLAGLSALHGGAGIARLFSLEDLGEAPLELICNPWSEKEWKLNLSKANAVFVGPGLGDKRLWMKKHLGKIHLPCVIDADALLADLKFPEKSILTPHRGEMLRLLKLKQAPSEEELFAKTIRFCEREKVVLVLKGAPTVVFSPKQKPVFIPRGDPGMATAGAGDVLTGLIAALLAQGMDLFESAVLGATLHAIAGEKAAASKTSYCLTATDLIAALPSAFRYAMINDIVETN